MLIILILSHIQDNKRAPLFVGIMETTLILENVMQWLFTLKEVYLPDLNSLSFSLNTS